MGECGEIVSALSGVKNAIDAAATMPEPPEEWAFEDVYGDRDIIAAIGGGLR